MAAELRHSSWAVADAESDSWLLAAGSVMVLTGLGIVVVCSPIGVPTPYTILHLVHAGRVHVGQLDEHRSPSQLAGLARRFAAEVASGESRP